MKRYLIKIKLYKGKETNIKTHGGRYSNRKILLAAIRDYFNRIDVDAITAVKEGWHKWQYYKEKEMRKNER